MTYFALVLRLRVFDFVSFYRRLLDGQHDLTANPLPLIYTSRR